MNEQEAIKKLEIEGYGKIWTYEAEPDEIDEEHSHNYDTKLYILGGFINITKSVNGVVVNYQYQAGDEVEIPRLQPHSAKVGSEGCRYIVAEKN